MSKRRICIVTGSRAEYGLLFWLMKEIEIDKDLATIVNALSLGGDARLYHLLKEVKEVRDLNPDGPYKKILREQKGISI